jgi:hypothetical protein
MLMQRLYLLYCPNFDCRDQIFLPRRSQLGIFEHPHNQPTDIWPIKYRCHRCGQWSDFQAEEIRLEGVEVQVQNLQKDVLWRYNFSSGQGNSERRYWLYMKAAPSWTAEQIVERLLIPSGMWEESHGKPEFLRIGQLQY